MKTEITLYTIYIDSNFINENIIKKELTQKHLKYKYRKAYMLTNIISVLHNYNSMAVISFINDVPSTLNNNLYNYFLNKLSALTCDDLRGTYYIDLLDYDNFIHLMIRKTGDI